MTKYFLDTYAIIEIIKGNRNYSRFLNGGFIMGILNLYELYYAILKDYGEDKAKEYFFQFKEYLVKFSDEDIFDASKLRLENKKAKISYTDSLGYIIAVKNNSLFLTGDKAFKDLNNVEFVK